MCKTCVKYVTWLSTYFTHSCHAHNLIIGCILYAFLFVPAGSFISMGLTTITLGILQHAPHGPCPRTAFWRMSRTIATLWHPSDPPEDPIGGTPARKYKPKSCNIAILTNVSSEDPFGTYFKKWSPPDPREGGRGGPA